jgi:hypothetical protein
MSDRLKPLSEGLGSLFTELERRARATVDLAAKVRDALPEEEKPHVLSATCKEETLVVLVDSAAWATHIRYAQKELLDRLHTAGETQFTKLKVKVGRRPAGGRRTADGGR